MIRPKISLALTVLSLAFSTAAFADDLPGQPSLSGDQVSLEVPPVLPPNDAVALSVDPNPASLDVPPVQTAAPVQTIAPAQTVAPLQSDIPAPALAPQASLAPVQGPAPAAAPALERQLVVDPTQPNQLAYFSPRLGARFLVEPVSMPKYGSFWAARIVSVPDHNSPLMQLGLGEGDLITRMDGLPLTCTIELERHVLETGIRFIRAGEYSVCHGTLFIDPGMYFVDPYAPVYPISAPVCSGSHSCGSLVLRP
jgi:hypothetical protein